MKAAYINQTGTPEVITYGDLPTPKPTRRQCLIKVAAVDVNPIDVYIRSGAIPAKLSFPFILGRDLAGTVVETGASVKDFKVGDRVWATSQGADGRPGTFAEFAAVDHRWLHPIPEGVSDEDIVALSLVGITAQLGLVRNANLKAGEMSVRQRRLGRRRLLRGADGQDPRRARHHHGGHRREGRGLPGPGRRPGDQLQDAGRGCRHQGVCARRASTSGGRRLREPDFDRTVALLATAGPDGPHGRTRCAPALPGRALLREGLLAARVCDVQCQLPRAARRGQRHQPLGGGRQTASAH